MMVLMVLIHTGLCDRICTLRWEDSEFSTSILDVCLLLFRVCGGFASVLVSVSLIDVQINTNCSFAPLRYKWNLSEVGLDRRLDFFESNWAFFAGFGNVLFYWLFYVNSDGIGKLYGSV